MPSRSGFKQLFILTTIIGIAIIIVTFSLSIATYVKINDDKNDGSSTTPATNNPSLVTYVQLEDAMTHLRQFQIFGSDGNKTRAVDFPGFNKTLDYIVEHLTANTDYHVNRTYFYIKNFELASEPFLSSKINGVTRNYTYALQPSSAEFYYMEYSAAYSNPDYIALTVIPYLGCFDADWQNALPSVAGRAAIVKRGDCPFVEKGRLAEKYNATALLLYNDGTSPGRIPPMYVSLDQDNTIPGLFLSYTVGQELVNAAQNESNNVQVQLNIELKDLPDLPVGNICADTPTGNVTQTIVIGSHSDSVPAGPGINDNGSGSAANLALAVALAHLYKTTSYEKYKYRVRFCWWGAEELGLLGSAYHVRQAKIATEVGERLEDYLINLNYDMLGSPNYFFGIYDGDTAPVNTPAKALPGSKRITALYEEWFNEQKLPWDHTDFSGRSDYGPFLAEGIVAGGLFSGADETKTQEIRDRYDRMLGQGMGGYAGVIADPCYHRACDTVENINTFVYERMIRAAAFVLEYLGREENLKTWLYPNNTMTE